MADHGSDDNSSDSDDEATAAFTQEVNFHREKLHKYAQREDDLYYVKDDDPQLIDDVGRWRCPLDCCLFARKGALKRHFSLAHTDDRLVSSTKQLKLARSMYKESRYDCIVTGKGSTKTP